jgi:hypothetical protein
LAAVTASSKHPSSAFGNSANVVWKHQAKFQGEFPKGGRQAAPSSPSYRLALVKPE